MNNLQLGNQSMNVEYLYKLNIWNTEMRVEKCHLSDACFGIKSNNHNINSNTNDATNNNNNNKTMRMDTNHDTTPVTLWENSALANNSKKQVQLCPSPRGSIMDRCGGSSGGG